MISDKNSLSIDSLMQIKEICDKNESKLSDLEKVCQDDPTFKEVVAQRWSKEIISVILSDTRIEPPTPSAMSTKEEIDPLLFAVISSFD